MLEDKRFTKAIYVVFSKTADNSSLKDDVRKSFQSKNENCELLTFNRSECLDYFEIMDDDDDGLNIINKIMESPKMESNVSIFFDETPIFRPKEHQQKYDWSLLRNPKPGSLLIVSFQPMVEAKNKSTTPISPTLPDQEHANIELTRCYRASVSIFDCLKSIKKLGMKMVKTTPEEVNFVSGREPLMMNYKDPTVVLKSWIHFKLFQLNCNKGG